MKSNSSLQSKAAFTLTELCVVLGCVAVLAMLVLPALAGSKGNSQVFQCMENTRRLTLAWRMYVEDNSDQLILSSDDGTGWANPLNAYAWTLTHLDFSGKPSNWEPTMDITTRPLYQYSKSPGIYKCPADTSKVTIASLPNGYTGPHKIGESVPRVRSISMNFFLGGFGGHDASSGIGVGAWGTKFPVYRKLTELGNSGRTPGPAKTFVFIDERPDCINWGCFLTDMTGYPYGTHQQSPAQYQWAADMPASYHNYAGRLSFADGHAEIHRWQDNVTLQPLKLDGVLSGPGSGAIFSDPHGQDVAWMQNVTARPR